MNALVVLAAVAFLFASAAQAQTRALVPVKPQPDNEQRAAPVAQAAMPKPGDTWTYQARDMDAPDAKRRVVFEVKAVGEGGIVEVGKRDDGSGFETTHRAGAYLRGVPGGGAVYFSPYFRAFEPFTAGQRWSNVPFEAMGLCSADPNLHCRVDALVAGRERVTVSAGTFDAWKIEATVNYGGNARGATRTWTYWFADEVRRPVKAQTRSQGIKGSARGGGFTANADFELVSYRQD